MPMEELLAMYGYGGGCGSGPSGASDTLPTHALRTDANSSSDDDALSSQDAMHDKDEATAPDNIKADADLERPAAGIDFIGVVQSHTARLLRCK